MTPSCESCGQGLPKLLDPAPTPEEVEAEAVKAATRTEADAEVEIARIEADTAVTLAKLERSALLDEERIELEALRVEVGVLRDQVAPPEPEPAPTPVEVVEAPPEDAGEPEGTPPVVEPSTTDAPKGKTRKNPWW